MSAAKTCEIYGVVHRKSWLWKWRYTSADGSITDCAEEFRHFLQCVAAARACGYEPRTDWTGPCAVLITPHRRPKAEHPNGAVAGRDCAGAAVDVVTDGTRRAK